MASKRCSLGRRKKNNKTFISVIFVLKKGIGFMLLNIKVGLCSHPGGGPTQGRSIRWPCERGSPPGLDPPTPWPGPLPAWAPAPRPGLLSDPARLLAAQGVSGDQHERPGSVSTSHFPRGVCTVPSTGTRGTQTPRMQGLLRGRGSEEGAPPSQGLCLAALPFGKPQTSLPDAVSSAQVLGDQGSGWAPHPVLGRSRVTACREGSTRPLRVSLAH